MGDWESDLVGGRKQHGALVTLVERRSRYTLIGKVATKQAEEVATTTIGLLDPQQQHTHTITADNGKEFAQHETVAAELDLYFYFAHPYASWERGANENMNGLVRQYLPKESDFTNVSDKELETIMYKLNHRPR